MPARPPCTHRATGGWHDVVVDRLGQADHGQFIIVLVQVLCEIGGSGIRVVTTDGVQDVHLVRLELLGGHLKCVLAGLDEPAIDEILGVCEFHARVADRRATEPGEDVGLFASLVVEHDRVAGQQTMVSVLVADDFGVGRFLRVPLDEVANRG